MSSSRGQNPLSRFLQMVCDMSPEQVRALTICVTYAVSSMTISMVYKAILSVWGFDGKFLLLAAQSAISLAVCLVLLYGMPHTAKRLQLQPFDPNLMASSLPLGMLYVLNISVGWFGLQLVDIPMFLAIRRTASLFVLGGEVLLLGAMPSPLVVVGISVIVLGTIIAGSDSFSDDYVGYMYTLGNNVVTALQLSFAKRFRTETGVQGFGLVFYNAITALPLSLAGAVLRGELEEAAAFEHLWNPGFYLCVLVASVMGCFMTYIVLLCATVNSPTVTSVTGNIKDVVATLVGALLFPGFEPSVPKIGGLLVSFVGGGIFTYGKLSRAEDSSVVQPAKEQPKHSSKV